jgi:ribulose-phosphate 3-epimerase
MIQIYPSLISSNLLTLKDTITTLEPYCDGFHIDVMDNHFVPNLTWGPIFVNQIAQCSIKPLAIHFMTDKTPDLIKQLTLKKESIISFHIEANAIQEILGLITLKKLRSSLALKPNTPLETIFPYVHTIDQILLMSVEPGFSGQQFLPQSIQKLKHLHEYKKNNNLFFEIAMDGGINADNIHKLAQLGCSVFYIASALFNAQDPLEQLKRLYSIASQR